MSTQKGGTTKYFLQLLPNIKKEKIKFRQKLWGKNVHVTKANNQNQEILQLRLLNNGVMK